MIVRGSYGFGTSPQQELVVTITGVDAETGKVLAVDKYGNETEFDTSVRSKGLGYPDVGEKWLMLKQGGGWVFSSQIGAAQIATIGGSRQGLHPVVTQMLDAMASQGLVIDATTSAPEVPIPDPYPYSPGDPEYVDPTFGDDGDPLLPDEVPYEDTIVGEDPGEGAEAGEETGEDSGPVDFPPNHIPSPVRPPVTAKPRTPGDLKYTNRWRSLYATTFNVYKTLGPATAENDLRKLTRTRSQIIGLQEAHGEERNGSFNRLRDRGWDVYRPKNGGFSDENTILWREDDFSLLDAGNLVLNTVDMPGMPTRYLNWVKLTYKPANRVIYFMSTHLDPKLDSKSGGPNWSKRARVLQAMVHIDKISDRMKAFGKYGPVITAGDFNLSAPKDAQARYPRFPYRKFGATGTKSNWAALGRPKGRASSIDHLYLTRGPHWNVKWVEHWGFTGYRSDHKPIMAQFSIRAKG